MKRFVFALVIVALLCSFLPQTAFAATDEIGLYTQYLLDTDYAVEGLGAVGSSPITEVQSLLIDLNGDGTQELFAAVYVGFDFQHENERRFLLLTIENGAVQKILDCYSDSTSWDGSEMRLLYDQIRDEYVIAIERYRRNVSSFTEQTLSIYGGENFSQSDRLSYVCHKISGYSGNLSTLRENTPYATESGSQRHCYYRNNQNISEEDYNSYYSRYYRNRYDTHKGTGEAPLVGYSGSAYSSVADTLQTLYYEDPVDYFVSNCDRHYFTEAEIASFGKDDCTYGRNAPYAKVGYVYQKGHHIYEYFSRFNWYSPTLPASDYRESMANCYMRHNLMLVLCYERKFNAGKSIAEPQSVEVPAYDASAVVHNGRILPVVSQGTLDASHFRMTKPQAEAYAQVLENAAERLQKEVPSDYDRTIIATLFDAGGKTNLHIAVAQIYANDDSYWGNWSVEYGEKMLDFVYEEIWTWNGSEAVEFDLVSKYGANVNVYEDGIEIYTHYRGTDVDGETWCAFLPFENGEISTQPQWSVTWCAMYSYRMEAANITSGSQAERSIAYYKYLIDQGIWPEFLVSDTQTLSIGELGTDWIVTTADGEGFEEFCEKYGYETGNHLPLYADGAVQKTGDIARSDNAWMDCTDAAAWLRAYEPPAEEEPEEMDIMMPDSEAIDAEEPEETDEIDDEDDDEKSDKDDESSVLILVLAAICAVSLITFVSAILVLIRRSKKTR